MCEFHLNKKKAKKERENPIPNTKNSQFQFSQAMALQNSRPFASRTKQHKTKPRRITLFFNL